MAISIKRLFTVTLFCLSTITLTGYIAPAQANKQEKIAKKILQNKLEAMLEAAAKGSMEHIEVLISKEDEKELVKLRKNLQKLLNFSLKEHKKHFSKLSLDQLELIIPKMQKLKALIQESIMSIDALARKIYQPLKMVEQEIEAQRVPREELKKEIEAGIALEWQEVIRVWHLEIKYEKNNPILLASDFEIMTRCGLDFLQEMEKRSLECSVMEQQLILASLKEMRQSMEKHVEAENELMVAMPDTLKKKLRQLAKKISQKVHAIPFNSSQADSNAYIIAYMMLFNK